MKQLMVILPPMIADGIGLALYGVLTPPLIDRFGEKLFSNSIVIGFYFFLFCAGVYALRKLDGGTNRLAWQRLRRPLLIATGPLLLVIVLAVADTVGFLESVLVVNNELLDEAGATIYLLITPASWICLAMFYPAMLVTEAIKPTVAPGTGRFMPVALLGLTAVNLLIIVIAAYAAVLWNIWQPAGSPFWLGALVLLIYLLLFLPARLPYIARFRTVFAFVPFVIMLGIFAARLVA